MSELRWSIPASVVVEHLEDGTVLFDTTTDTVLCLAGPEAAVIAALGGTTIGEIAERTGLQDDIVAAYLGELADRGLVVAAEADPRLARRTLARTAAGAAVALGVWSLVAPTAAAADSGGFGGGGY